MNNRIKIYTDGACAGNQLQENKGGYRNATNNRMELKSAIEIFKIVSSLLSVMMKF